MEYPTVIVNVETTRREGRKWCLVNVVINMDGKWNGQWLRVKKGAETKSEALARALDAVLFKTERGCHEE